MKSENRVAWFASRIAVYRKDINQFAKDMFSFIADDWQEEFFHLVETERRISVKSGQGVGKTAATGVVVLWFLSCFPNARVVATAPTGHQLHDVLWSELAKWLDRSPVLSEVLKWTKTYVYVKGKEKRWFAVARSSNKPENMQGFHEDNMLFVVDEASGVMNSIIEAIMGTLSGDNNKLVMLGNPTQNSGAFYDSHTADRHLFACMTVNSEDSKRTNKDTIETLKRKYGADSNVCRVRIYGLFPKQEDDVFIPFDSLERSIMTDYEITSESEITSIDIGCDVARFGDDKTVISYKVNKKCQIYKKIHGQDTMTTAKRIAELGSKLVDKFRYKHPIPVKVDDGGVGGGVVDKLRELTHEDPKRFWWLKVFPVHFGAPIKHKYYADSTTYMMSVVRDLISTVDDDGNNKEVELVLPNDSDLLAQLSVRKYSFTSNGKQKVESKQTMKDRGIASPDEADSILLCCLPARIKERNEMKNGKS